MSWCTIESDPGVFTSLIEDIGVRGVQVEELYSLDESCLNPLGEAPYGLVFLFKWDPQVARPSTSIPNVTIPEDLFFAKQVINNACATQALLSILFNIHADAPLELGDTLTEFQAFTQNFPPDLKGLAISNSDAIRTAHNSFTPPEPFVTDTREDKNEDGEAFHFVAYVPFRGYVYELDGLQEAPVCLGAIDHSSSSWMSVVNPFIQARIARYSSSEIRFNLLALIQNRKQLYERQLAALDGETDNSNIAAELHAKIQMEDERVVNWKIEDTRRKHNYLPFIIQLLKILAQKKKLQPLIQAQIERQQAQTQ